MEQKQYPPPYDYQTVPSAPLHSTQPNLPPPVTHVTQVNVTAAPVGRGGSCPICHAGNFRTGFTVCGWLCCIFCFPCGILFCCCCMKQKKCSNCGFSPS